MTRGIIYLITNKENGHKYVGQTTLAMNKEWQQHIQEALRMSEKPIHKAMRKYGNHRFTIQEIDECDASLLNEKEDYWIHHYNTFENVEGYNKPLEHIPNIPIVLSETEKVKKQPWGSLTDKNRSDGKHSGLRIRGKNLETGEVKEWESIRAAATEVTGDPNKNGNILVSARKGYKCYGYKWQIMDDKTKKKPVFGVNKKTEQIEVRFESITAAIRQLGGESKGTGIIKSLKHPGRFSWRGYWWFYS